MMYFSDWNIYYNAAITFLHFGNPYVDPYFMNPFWILFLIAPFTIFNLTTSYCLFFGFSIFLLLLFCRIMKVSLVKTFFLLISFPFLLSIFYGNIDVISLFSLILPAPFSILIAMIKPQHGIFIIFYWLIKSFKDGGFRLLYKNFYLGILFLSLSFIFYGAWFLNRVPVTSASWNHSFFPYSLIFLPFSIYYILIKENKNFSLLGSLLVSPYYSAHSLMFMPIAFFENNLFWLVYFATQILTLKGILF